MKRAISFILFAVMVLSVFSFQISDDTEVKAVNDKLEGHSPISLGDDFCAYIRQPATNLYLTDKNSNVCAAKGIFDKTQVWHFVRQSNGAYTIRNITSNKFMDVDNANFSDGTNVKTYQNTGHEAQQFFLYYISGNFYLKSLGDKTLDVDAATKNVQIYGCSTGIDGKETNPISYNARSFEVLKIQIDLSAWNSNFGSGYNCYIMNWHSGLYMTAVGDNVVFKKATCANDQKWNITRNEYGGHIIKSVSTGKVLDVQGASLEHGTNIDLYVQNNSKAQTFFFIDTGESRVYIKPSFTNTVVDMDANNFEIHACGYGGQEANIKAQVFEIITEQHIGGDGYVRQPRYLGEKVTATISLNSSREALTDNESSALLKANTGSKRQIWTLQYDKNWNAYTIIGSSGKVLDVSGAGYKNGTRLSVYPSNNSVAQKFRFYECTGGFLISPVHTQKIINVKSEDGMSLHLYDTIPNANNLFCLTLLSIDGQEHLDLGDEFVSVIKHKNSGLYLTGKSSGTLSCTSSASNWRFIRQPNGSYVIKNDAFGKVLDVEGGVVKDGTGVQLYTANGTLNQGFFIYSTKGGYMLRCAKSGAAIDMNSSSKEVHAYFLGTSQGNIDARTFVLEGIALKPDSEYVRTKSVVKRVPEGSTASQIVSQFATENLVVLDNNGVSATGDTLCGTGSSVNVMSGNKAVSSLSLVVAGDVDGNSIIDTTDYLRIKSAFLGVHKLEGVYFMAGDVDNNNVIDTTDYLKIKSAFLGLYNLDTIPYEGFDAYADNGGNNVNYLCGIDSFGRVFEPVAGFDDSKDVGMFYFIWHGDSGRSTLNVTEILAKDPQSLLNINSNMNKWHYWGEPLYGYYNSWEDWVLRRHVEMFINAGIDYLVFDATNGYIYERAYTALFNVLTEYQKQGWDIPLICFYTNTNSYSTVNNLYNRLYKPNKYRSLWYCPTGNKPMIITDTSDPGFKNNTLLSNFYVRESQWPNVSYKANGVPWMEWTYPQPVYNNGYMNVSVAQHTQLPFSASIKDRNRNQGRGYDYLTRKNIEADMRKGTNFQTQWNTGLYEPKVSNIFVTGWNEWIVLKANINNEAYFVDCVNEEFSRDIEPMKGGYEDAYYIQLCDNVRRFKGLDGEIRKVPSQTIDINGDISQWNGVNSTYNAVSQNSVKRDALSVDSKYSYKVDAARNNIQQVKIANDAENIYFYAKAQNNMTSVNSSDFVNFYFGVGNIELKGWNGYEYVLSCGDKAVYKLDSKGNRQKVAGAKVEVIGNVVHASVSRASVGAQNQEGIYFKATDGVNSTNILDTYTLGKSLPMGRLSYYYYFGE